MTDAPTTRETADRETLVMQSIIDAHGQWEIENRNRKQGDGQLWQDGHVRLLAQAAIIATDHIGEANEKVADHIGDATTMIDYAEQARTFEALAVEACAARNLDGAESMMVSIQTIYDLITSRNALLSEIAALRGERDGLKNRVSCLERLCGEQSTRVMEQATRAKDAERQRDELLAAIDDVLPSDHSLRSFL